MGIKGLGQGCGERSPGGRWMCTDHDEVAGHILHVGARTEDTVVAEWVDKNAIEIHVDDDPWDNHAVAKEAFVAAFPQYGPAPSDEEVEAAITATIAMMKDLQT